MLTVSYDALGNGLGPYFGFVCGVPDQMGRQTPFRNPLSGMIELVALHPDTVESSLDRRGPQKWIVLHFASDLG